MKVICILACLIGSIAAQTCDYNHGNGQPACIASEMGRLWRNNWDPTKYWMCQSINSPATEIQCDVGFGFLESAQTCVNWSQWQWTFPCDPPSGVVSADIPSNRCIYTHGNGRPACIASEMGRLWRHNWDPSRFWMCSQIGRVAEELICATGTGFSETAQTCVDWTAWQWAFPCDPPSGGN